MIQLSIQSTRKAAARRYLILRFAIILLGLCLVLLYQMGLEDNEKLERVQFVYLTLGTYLLVALSSMAIASRFLEHPWFSRIQVTIDLIVGVALTAVSGGVLSVFCPLLFISLFNASTVLKRREVFAFAAIATTALAVVTLGHSTGVLPVQTPRLQSIFERQQLGLVSTYLIGVGVALHLVAFLGSQLTSGLWRIQNFNLDLIENIGEGLIAVDPKGILLHANGEACRILNIDASEHTGKSIDQVLSDPSYKEWVDLLKSQRRGGVKEFYWESADGRVAPYEIRITPSHGEQGARPFRVALFRDLGLEREVEVAERRIRQLEELYEMALGIAHEIRNPLASIRGCVQEIGRETTEFETRSRLIEIVCKESDRLDQIVEDFLCFTRKRPRPTMLMNLRDIVDDFGLLISRNDARKNRAVELDLTEDDVWIHGDRERIQQILLNLVLNAFDATDPERGMIQIRLFESKVQGQAPMVCISVEDNGEGITEEDQEKLFAPFFTRKEKGTGLGLSLVHRFIRDHEGSIQVESKVGEGTKFLVSLPWVQMEPELSEELKSTKIVALEPKSLST